MLLVGVNSTAAGAASVLIQAANPVNTASGPCDNATTVVQALRRRRLESAAAAALDVTLSIGLPASGLPALALLLAEIDSPDAHPLSSFVAAAASAIGLPPSSIRLRSNASAVVIGPSSATTPGATSSSGGGLGVPVLASIAAAALLLCAAFVACVVLRRRRALKSPAGVTDSRIPDEHLDASGTIENPIGARRNGTADDRARDLRDPSHAALARHGSRRVKHEFQATLPSLLPEDGDESAGNAQSREALPLEHERTGHQVLFGAHLGLGGARRSVLMTQAGPEDALGGTDDTVSTHSNPIGRRGGGNGVAAVVSGGAVSAAPKSNTHAPLPRPLHQQARGSPCAATVQVNAEGHLTPLSNPLRSGDGKGDRGPRARNARLGGDGTAMPGEYDNPIGGGAAARLRDVQLHGESGGRPPASGGGLGGDALSASMAMYASPKGASRAGHRYAGTSS